MTVVFSRSLLAAFLAAFFVSFTGLPLTAQDQEAAVEAPLVEGLKDLKDLNRRIVKMADPGSGATVALIGKRGAGSGSGVVISEDGLILTAAHVLEAVGDEVIVLFPDGTEKEGETLGADFDRDAGLVRITEEGSYPHVEMGSSEDLPRNEWCIATGHPGGYDPARMPPLRLGRLLESGRFLVTDCAIVSGDSGGPLFDKDGKVIGIHSNIGASLMENRHVPVDVFINQMDRLKDGERFGRRFSMRGPPIDPDRPVLGLQLGPEVEGGGVPIMGAMPNSPAGEKGIRAGDVIVAIEGDDIDTREELIDTIGEFEPGDEVSVKYLRGDRERAVDVKLAKLGDLFPQRRGGPRNRERGGRDRSDDDDDDDEEDAEREERERRAPSRDDDEERERMAQRRFEEAPGPDLFFESSMKALMPVMKKASGSTVAVFADGEPAALGTVVTDDGGILTMNTETADGDITMVSGGDEIDLELVKRFPKRDLALYRAKEASLTPVKWASEGKEAPVGSLLTASGPDGLPLGIGLVSAPVRALGEVGFLGIQMDSSDNGVLVVRVIEDGPASKAGLKAGDVITALDGIDAGSPYAFGKRVRSLKTGEEVEVEYLRGEEPGELEVKLGEREEFGSSPRFERMNRMAGPLSDRKSGYPSALQHDIPLSPLACGGPLLDLNGRCVGINVSRSGRVETLAIPAADIRGLLDEAPVAEKSEAASKPKRNSRNRPDGISRDERDDILDALSKLREELEAIEKRVRKIEVR